MKPSLIIPVQDPTPYSPVASVTDLKANLARAAIAGYEGVELAITDPGKVDAGSMKELLERHGLTLSAITTGQAYGLEGISFTAPEEEPRRKAIERIKRHARLARKFDADAVVIIGLIRGERGDRVGRRQLREALQECAGEDSRVKFALEPINRYETGLINTVEEALGLLDEIGLANVGLLFDTFHANIEERSLAESIRLAGKKLLHVHIADSNRFAPGYGHLDFGEIGDALREVRYQRFCSLEALARPTPDACMEESARFIKEL
jgi:sugar phosphate isomerase/epimerase